MAQNDEKLKRTVAGFAVLLTTVTEMVRSKAVKPALLDAYDDASDQIIDGLRGNGSTSTPRVLKWSAMPPALSAGRRTKTMLVCTSTGRPSARSPSPSRAAL